MANMNISIAKAETVSNSAQYDSMSLLRYEATVSQRVANQERTTKNSQFLSRYFISNYFDLFPSCSGQSTPLLMRKQLVMLSKINEKSAAVLARLMIIRVLRVVNKAMITVVFAFSCFSIIVVIRRRKRSANLLGSTKKVAVTRATAST